MNILGNGLFFLSPLCLQFLRNISGHKLLDSNLQVQQPVPEYMQGLIGTRPSALGGALYQDFLNHWLGLDPDVFPGAGGPLSVSTSSHTTDINQVHTETKVWKHL